MISEISLWSAVCRRAGSSVRPPERCLGFEVAGLGFGVLGWGLGVWGLGSLIAGGRS